MHTGPRQIQIRILARRPDVTCDDTISHLIEVRFVHDALCWHHGRPHHAEPHDVEAPRLQPRRVVAPKRARGVEGAARREVRADLLDRVHAVEDARAAALVDDEVRREVDVVCRARGRAQAGAERDDERRPLAHDLGGKKLLRCPRASLSRPSVKTGLLSPHYPVRHYLSGLILTSLLSSCFLLTADDVRAGNSLIIPLNNSPTRGRSSKAVALFLAATL